MKRGPFVTAFGRMLLWMLSLLLLVHLITWLSPEQDGAPVVPGWAELIVWALFIVPVVPAMIAGVARLRGHEKWKPILLGVVFGVLTPLFGVISLAATFLLIGGSVDLGPDDEGISELLILATLFSTVIALGVGTALLRHNTSKL
jgi:O-antigen/teichoic acid export membrane protein